MKLLITRKFTTFWLWLIVKIKKIQFLLMDWRFDYKLITFLTFFIFFLLGIIFGVFIEFWYVKPDLNSYYNGISLPRLYNLNVMVSFWSVQTNFLGMFYFFFALKYHNKEQKSKFSNFTTQTSVTLYITLTMILFWLLVFYGVGTGTTYEFASLMDTIVTSVMHAITPALTLIYLLLSLGRNKITYKEFFYKKVFWMLAYPIGYLIFLNLRAYLLYQDGIRDGFLFPYDFVNFYKPILALPVVWNNVVLIVIGITILVIMNLIVISLNKVIYQKTNGQGFLNFKIKKK